MHGERPQLSDIMHAEPVLQPVPVQAEASADDAMPLPTDCDFDPIPDATPAFTDVPTFSSITFDEPAPDAPATQPDIQPTTTPNNPISEYLTQHNRPAVTEGELIISDNLAIAIHDDPDFWIADDTHWFANGKQRPSPIAALTDAAARGLTPILYISEQNFFEDNEEEEPKEKSAFAKHWWKVLLGILGIALIVGAPEEMSGHFVVFELACVVGFYVITNVTHTLHTPLMSVTNAISGIIIVGAILQIGSPDPIIAALSFIAMTIASINIFGGFLVTHRMLKMFQRSSED